MEDKKLNNQMDLTNAEMPDEALDNAAGGARNPTAAPFQLPTFYSCKNCNNSGLMSAVQLEIHNWRCLSCGAYIEH